MGSYLSIAHHALKSLIRLRGKKHMYVFQSRVKQSNVDLGVVLEFFKISIIAVDYTVNNTEPDFGVLGFCIS
jgi:hypothetical protein